MFGTCWSGFWHSFRRGHRDKLPPWALKSTLVHDLAVQLEHSGGPSVSCFVLLSKPWAVLFALLFRLL